MNGHFLDVCHKLNLLIEGIIEIGTSISGKESMTIGLHPFVHWPCIHPTLTANNMDCQDTWLS